MGFGRRPTTDFGTVLFHWLTVAAVVWLLVTGLRIASDDPQSRWLALLDPVLQMNQIWLSHLLGGSILTCTAAAYVSYMKTGAIVRRVQLDRNRIRSLLTARASWPTVNIVLYWVLYIALSFIIISGWLLLNGSQSTILRLHFYVSLVVVLFVPTHLWVQIRIGGLNQLMRVFRPARLPKPAPALDLAELVAELLEARKREQSKPTPGPRTAGKQPQEPDDDI
ncbi:cytochrome b/b6 domain-containing protein [Rhizobium leguminosarum]|uniref:cytochrome b/b6 domain-containing protein n=1 Tax=Rhizobium leguminosarum TaxID=384 RepID=UPI00102F55F8|nr:cytochrome b/b6 domain-containing protein [Rhizobium leguminosarum]TAZ44377.1 cytochrome b/b6 domain-containing protein [Rhizobium leguminosarum]